MKNQSRGELTIRKSVIILLSKILTLQAVLVMLYLVIRLSKIVILQQIFAENDYHELNFWLGMGVFLTLAIAQAGIVVALVLEWLYEYYEIREDIIVHTKGVLHKKEDIYSLKTIEAGNVTQSLMGKLLNYGTIRIYSPVLKREYFLHDIPDPHHMRDSVLALLGGKASDDRKIIPLGSSDHSG